jgi:hypothetical protein
MKHKAIIFVFILACNYLSVSAQPKVHYTYDASGNRTSRWVDATPVPYHASSNDTTVELQVNNLLKQDKCTPDSEKNKALAGGEQGAIKVYPNPVVEKLNVDIPEGTNGGSLLLYDGNGRLVLSQTNVRTHNELDLSAQNKGNYFLVFQTVNGKRMFWKLVKY